MAVSEVRGTPPQVTYTPPEFVVTETFAFKIFDSEPALVSIDVTTGGPAGGSGPTFIDVAPSNKIDDALDGAIFLSPGSSFDVVVIFTSSFLDVAGDEAPLSVLVGRFVNEPGGVPITAVTAAIDAVSMTLTGSQINTLAEFNVVIKIEEDTAFSFPGF